MRRLRAGQLAGRLRRVIPPVVLAAGLRPVSTVGWRPIAGGLGVDPAPQHGPAPSPEGDGVFRGPGGQREFGHPRFWTDPGDGLLFLFHLHGFAPLAAYAADSRSTHGDRFWAAVIEDWLRTQPVPRGPAWHPFPTSVRIVSWAAAVSGIDGLPARLVERMVAQIGLQARYLRRAVEHDIGGNHVLRNAVALIFAGAVLPSSRLLGPGLRLLRRELGRQLLSDGGHEERSTSYHRQVAHDLGDVMALLQRGGHPLPGWLESAGAASERWLAAMVGPDGTLPLLNDAWEGPPREGRLEEPVTELAATGYTVLRRGGDQAVFDHGPLCPPHLPPHAHADALSFVLWADGEPIVVDPGSFTYTGKWRDAFRGTAAHNTVEVDGEDQCHFWGDFRLAYAPRVRAAAPRRDGDAVVLAASHDGYGRLADPVEHHRALVWLPGLGLLVVDRLACRLPHRVRSSLHLHPGAEVDGVGLIGPFAATALGAGPAARLAEGAYASHLGQRQPAPVLRVERTVDPELPFGWSLLRTGARVVRLTTKEVVLEGSGGSRSVRLQWVG